MIIAMCATVCYTKSQMTAYLAAKQDTLTNAARTGVDLLCTGTIRTLNFGGAIAYAFSNSFNTLEINVPCYTQTESNARYTQIDPSSFSVVNSNGPELKLTTTSSRTEVRFKGGVLRIRRQAGNGTLTNHCQFADSTGGSTIFYNGVSSTSDSRIKDNQQAMSTQDAFDILTAVQAKTYTRNDQDNAPKIGFIAQDMETACTGNFACLVGSTAGDEDTPPLKTLDYARLSSILWTVCRNLHSRLTALETSNGAA